VKDRAIAVFRYDSDCDAAPALAESLFKNTFNFDRIGCECDQLQTENYTNEHTCFPNKHSDLLSLNHQGESQKKQSIYGLALVSNQPVP
jgi:hypothetical protein